MAELNSFLTGIADAIRTKNETTEPINAQNFANEILNIKTGDTETEDGIIDGTITKITNNRVEIIKPYTFQSCSYLTEANFQNCISIYSDAFDDCTNLTTISFPKCVKMYGAVFRRTNLTEAIFPECEYIGGSYTFSSCKNLKKITFPKLMFIPHYCFAKCAMLSEINFPVCSYISSGAFSSCSSLTSLNFINCCSIGSSAFAYCTKLQSVWLYTYSCDLANASVFNATPMVDSSYLGNYGSIYVPNDAVENFKVKTNWTKYADRITNLPSEYDTKYVYGYEYYQNNELVNIPSKKINAINIGQSAFTKCSNLIEANFPECEYIGLGAFQSAISLSKAIFPKCKTVATSVFKGCTNLTEAIFPELIKIASEMFSNGSNLTTISFPKCEIIDYYGLPKLRTPELILPNLKYISVSAFAYGTGITTASFPKCEYIATYAFQGCVNLLSFYLNVKKVPFLQSMVAFSSTPITYSYYFKSYGSIYVPTSLYESFITDENWSRLSSRIVAMDFED